MRQIEYDVLLSNYRDAWKALAVIREAVEDCAPPGSVVSGEYAGPEPMMEAEAIIRGVYAIAPHSERGGSPPKPLTDK